MTFGFIECMLIAISYMFVGYVTAMWQKRYAEFKAERDPGWLAIVWVMWPFAWLTKLLMLVAYGTIWFFDKMGRLVK